MFKLSGDEVLEYRVLIKADRVSPFDLAASWRAYQENFQPSTVRGIPDVSINSATEANNEVGIECAIIMRKFPTCVIYLLPPLVSNIAMCFT